VTNFPIKTTIKQARALEKNGEFVEAKKLYETLLLEFPQSRYAKRELERLKWRVSKSAFKKTGSWEVQELVDLIKIGQFDKAEEVVDLMLSEHEDDHDIWGLYGIVLANLNKLEESEKAFIKALLLAPDSPEILNNFGLLLCKQKRWKEAIEKFDKAISISPDFTHAYFNLGNALKSARNYDEAIKAYEISVNKKPDFFRAYMNMGNALAEIGRFTDAEAALAKAHSLEPKNPHANFNLGNIYKQRNNLIKSEELYKRALAIKPNFLEAMVNLGNLYVQKNQSKLAEETFRKALSICPDHAGALCNFGVFLMKEGKLEASVSAFKEAILNDREHLEAYNGLGLALGCMGLDDQAIDIFVKGLLISPSDPKTLVNFGTAVQDREFLTARSELFPIFTKLLDNSTYIRPKDISNALISLLKHEDAFQNFLNLNPLTEDWKSLTNIISEIANFSAFIKLMKVCPVPDLAIEKSLINLRSYFLHAFLQGNVSSELLPLQSALAIQCFFNEYIYTSNEGDEEALLAIEAQVIRDLATGNEPGPSAILSLASFKPLLDYNWHNLLPVSDEISETFRRQVTEPLLEQQIKNKTSKLKELSDDVSIEVGRQYEENPYPRWENLALPSQKATIQNYFGERDIQICDTKIFSSNDIKILIAGCGTGQQSIGTAATFENSSVTAIDLSLASIAYAARKTSEFGITNIKYHQADILDVDMFEQKFDIIETVGVLHHMSNPILGLNALTKILKPGGLMKIGLYSRLARRTIARIREELLAEQVQVSPSFIKAFRQNLIEANDASYQQIYNSFDFFNLSSFRDLLFHVVEHNFSIPEIDDCLSQSSLRFCGFTSKKVTRAFLSSGSTSQDLLDLNKWNTFEESHPDAFAGMYQFWCQKLEY